ncbi:hypothetical protein GALL_427550 [mine drainage metagenome]|uniref:Uncharacterized protein n=1 Tax=mine drainage metagenome TaxID=410659 RepID=A0A1J5PVT4_9ZZZZ
MDAARRLCLYKGYDFDEVREIVKEFGFTAHTRARGGKAQAIKHEAGFRARGQVVDRPHDRMNRLPHILALREKIAGTYPAMPHLGLGIMTWRATGLMKQSPGLLRRRWREAFILHLIGLGHLQDNGT